MVKHALLVCMAADALITIQKLSKKRSLREKEIIYERKHIEIFEKHWNTAYIMLSNGMDELRRPPNPDDPPPVKPLMYTCYLLGVAAVFLPQHPLPLREIDVFVAGLCRSSACSGDAV